mgnify:CR=1 FL=1
MPDLSAEERKALLSELNEALATNSISIGDAIKIIRKIL